MDKRYYIDWQHNRRDLIRIVRHVPTLDVVGVVTVRPHEQDYLVDTFEVEWLSGKSTVRGRRAATLIEGFLRDFQKATQRKLFCLVRTDNKRHQDIIEKRGWTHVANLLEYKPNE